jgi:hypothetical protein
MMKRLIGSYHIFFSQGKRQLTKKLMIRFISHEITDKIDTPINTNRKTYAVIYSSQRENDFSSSMVEQIHAL